MPRWFQVHLIRRIETILRSKWARPTAALLTLLLVIPVAALAQGSPFDTGFNAIQSLFTGTIAKVASLVAIVIGGYGFAHGEPGAKKALAGVALPSAIGLRTAILRSSASWQSPNATSCATTPRNSKSPVWRWCDAASR
jgi:type IV secretion system protein VirB2